MLYTKMVSNLILNVTRLMCSPFVKQFVMLLKCEASVGLPIIIIDANVAKPLYKLISGENTAKKQNSI